jgi:hypothetical protein
MEAVVQEKKTSLVSLILVCQHNLTVTSEKEASPLFDDEKEEYIFFFCSLVYRFLSRTPISLWLLCLSLMSEMI